VEEERDGRTVSWEATSEVIAQSKQKGSGLLTMLIVANYSDPFGFSWPSIRTVARDARLSERNIQYLTRKATELGELEVFPKAGPVITKGPSKGQRTNLFRITLCKSPPPEHAYFGIKRWCKDFTTSDEKVVQESSMGGASHREGGESQRRKVVQRVAPDPSGTVNEPSGSSAVDKSTSAQNGKTRQCTHLGCPPEFCRYSREGFDAQDVENAGAVAARVMNQVAR
jgi:hypothetical protein